MPSLIEVSNHPPVAGRKIALFAGAYNHISDGVALTLNRLVRYLEDRGADVLIFAPTSNKPVPFLHNGTLISVPSIPFPGRSDYRLTVGVSRKGWSHLKAFKPDLIHIATPDYAGAQALRWAKSRQIPVVSSFHTHFVAYLRYFASYNPLYRMDLLENTAWRYGRWFYSQVEHIYVPSPSIESELRAQGINNDIRVWARGVDAQRFSPSHRSQEWRSSLGFAENDVVISYIGRLVWEKNLTIFAEVIENLTALGIPHKSLIVGDGPALTTLRPRLSNTIFTGPLQGNELAKAYASSDIFLFPSDTETFGNVTLEAMASGIPTICADATGSDFLVEHGRTGYLAPPKKSSVFLEYVRDLIFDSHMRREFGHAARKRALAFEWTRVMEHLASYYQDVWGANTDHLIPGLATARSKVPLQKAVA